MYGAATYAVLIDTMEVQIMKKVSRGALFVLLSVVSLPVLASSKLTPQQCSDYPFVQTGHAVTHRQFENEIAELESVGYSPSGSDNNDYPQEIEAAEKRLQAKYRQDCLPHAYGGPNP